MYHGSNALKMYDGSNALQKCMMATMLLKNVLWQQCPSEMYDGSNALQKCIMAAMLLKMYDGNDVF